MNIYLKRNDLAIYGGEPYRKEPFRQWPLAGNEEREILSEVLDSGNWWRISGTKVKEFEDKFAELQSCKYCLGVTSGTHALELCLQALELHPGDEVIVPAFTFISTVTAVINCGLTPVLSDVDGETYCMTPQTLEKVITSKTKAVIPVHMAGNACDMEGICNIAHKFGIYIVEDAAHAHGGEWNNQRLGSYGDFGIFSFQNGKLMTCGEGGCIVTNSEDLYRRIYLLHGVGRPENDKGYHHLVLGSTCRMSEFHAAVLLPQINRINSMNQRREYNAAYLDSLLEKVSGIIPQKRTSRTTIFTHYMYMFYYESDKFGGISRDEFVDILNKEGIPAFIAFPVVSTVEFFVNQNFEDKIENYDYTKENDLKCAKIIANNVVWLHHRVLNGNAKDLDDVAGAIQKIQNCLL